AMTVHTAGPSDAQGVSISDTFPAGFTRGPVCDASGIVTLGVGGNFTATLGTIAAGADKAITVTFTVPATTQPGPQTNTVTTTSTTSDSNHNKNAAKENDTVLTSADLSITKSDGVTVVTAGDDVTYTYTITVHTSGQSHAQGLSVNDTWPAGFPQGTVSDTFGNVTLGAGGNFTATLGTIAAGADKAITVTFTVPATTLPGPQTNTVVTTSTTSDS